MIFHYIPRASQEVAKFYLPLVDPDADPADDAAWMAAAAEGGPCGDGWVNEGH